MKFQMLAIGARFEFEGKVYLKTGPLTATSDGVQRMIPRFALLKPLDAPPEQKRNRPRLLDESVVMSAFEAFHADCIGMLKLAECGAAHASGWQPELDAARRRFLAALADASDVAS